jgi:hypothetical protein
VLKSWHLVHFLSGQKACNLKNTFKAAMLYRNNILHHHTETSIPILPRKGRLIAISQIKALIKAYDYIDQGGKQSGMK